MEPEIRYTTTSDGVSIAYYAMGEGHPLVIASTVLWSNLQLQNVHEFYRSSSGRGLGRGLQVVRYDARGTGLSDRRTLDFTMEARLLDLEAVVERLHLARFALCGVAYGGFAAIAYAAGRPERVSHLILVDAYARGRDWRASPAVRGWESFRDTADEQWEQFTLASASRVLAFSDSESARKLAALYRESMTPESLRATYAAQDAIDVTALLARVAAPTLVMYRSRSANTISLDLSQDVASKIPDARFVKTTTPDNLTWTDEQTRIVEDFLGVHDVPQPTSIAPRSEAPHGTAVILFTDIVDSTALTERMGDAAFRARARDLDTSMRGIIAEAGGSVIDAKTLGDGVLATFSGASQAIDAALRCGAAGDAQGLPLHLGLHAGDVIREEGNVFGGAVNIAARISALSAPGEVLVSDIVRGLARTSADVTFEDHGEHALKGVADAQRVYAVRKDSA
jgi:class 3 adenylate cyclase